MYLKIKRLFILPLLCFMLLSGTVYNAYRSPIIAQATGLESVALGWLFSVMAYLGQSYANTDDAKRSLTDLRAYISDEVSQMVTNSQTVTPIIVKGLEFQMKLEYFVISDFIFGKGDIQGAKDYAVANNVSGDSFNMVVKIVRAFFESIIDWTKTELGKITTVLKTLSATSYINGSFEQYLFSSDLSTLMNNNNMADYKLSKIQEYYTSLPVETKQRIFNTYGKKFYVKLISQSDYYKTVYIFDLPENTTDIFYDLATSKYNFFYVVGGLSFYSAKNYPTVDNTPFCTLDVNVINGGGTTTFGGNGSSYSGTYYNNYSVVYGGNMFGSFISQFVGSGGSRSVTSFVGLDDVNRYNSLADKNADIKSTSPVIPITNTDVSVPEYSITTVGDVTEEDRAIPIDNVTPLDADTTAKQVVDGELSDVKIGGAAITDTIPDTIPTTAEPVDASSGVGAYRLFLLDIFPFCIPFDLYDFIKVFDAEAMPPTVKLSVMIPIVNTPFEYTVDLAFLNPLALVLRALESALWIMGLMFITSKMIKW